MLVIIIIIALLIFISMYISKSNREERREEREFKNEIKQFYGAAIITEALKQQTGAPFTLYSKPNDENAILQHDK